MSSHEEEDVQAASAAEERIAIGITFGNSNSSIAVAYASGEGKAEVIANEEGGKMIEHDVAASYDCFADSLIRSSYTLNTLICRW